ncbi:leader peptidase (prepilin peptidase) / N-methyltransferase [Thermomonospora echinospora]|uniref:Leader peptidase (Prepilin peptidase) / N-methyltransferase n=1 Tax=Thermomonospora echinospora TaxID=1992 RepID=A0A1H5SJ76_9ACTN|nr:A24 family peptidase [Thermomonospora echinospora]SEF50666.1 leader peptidase (prepilin peptidase) / N-methyltransferase [Thermomonospora echinospora]
MDAAPGPGAQAPGGRERFAPVARRPALTAALAVAVVTLLGWRFGPRPELAAFVYFGVVAVLLAVIDAAIKRLPDPLTLPSYPVGAALLGAAAPFTEDGGARYLHALIGMAALWLLYAVQWFLVPGQLGFGDVKLAGVLGLYLGWLGPAAAVAGVLAIHVSSALYALALLLTGRAGPRTQIPFGPFMIAGTLFAVTLYAPGWNG